MVLTRGSWSTRNNFSKPFLLRSNKENRIQCVGGDIVRPLTQLKRPTEPNLPQSHSSLRHFFSPCQSKWEIFGLSPVSSHFFFGDVNGAPAIDTYSCPTYKKNKNRQSVNWDESKFTLTTRGVTCLKKPTLRVTNRVIKPRDWVWDISHPTPKPLN